MVRGLGSGIVAHEEDFFARLTPIGVHSGCANNVDL